MIICVCNNLNSKKVEEAVSAGATSCAKVYKYHATRPQCCRCVESMRETVAQLTSQPSKLERA